MNKNTVVVLCRPEIPENIGFTARCLRAYGLEELRLVGVPAPDAGGRAFWTARSGEGLLREAKMFATLAEAIGDREQALGFTRRDRGRDQTLFELGEVQARFENRLDPNHQARETFPIPGLRTALVFGCESDGLSQEETLQLTHLIRIPLIDPELSLNLSHAVAIALYALSGGKFAVESKRPGTTTLSQSQATLDQVMDALDRNGFLAKGKKETVRRETVELLWRRIRPTRGELDFICGALKALLERAEA